MGLTNHGYQLLTKWDDPPSIGILQTPHFGITNLEIDLRTDPEVIGLLGHCD